MKSCEIRVLTYLFVAKIEKIRGAGCIFLLQTVQKPPCVDILRDTTSGCFSNTLPRELPNGWKYTIAFQLFTDTNNICYEGLGLPPDIVMNNFLTDIDRQYDEVLEKALDLLK